MNTPKFEVGDVVEHVIGNRGTITAVFSGDGLPDYHVKTPDGVQWACEGSLFAVEPLVNAVRKARHKTKGQK